MWGRKRRRDLFGMRKNWKDRKWGGAKALLLESTYFNKLGYTLHKSALPVQFSLCPKVYNKSCIGSFFFSFECREE